MTESTDEGCGQRNRERGLAVPSHRKLLKKRSTRHMSPSRTFISLLALSVGALASVLLFSSPALAASTSTTTTPSLKALIKDARPNASLSSFMNAVGPTTSAEVADSPDLPEVDPTGISSPALLTEPLGSFATLSNWQDTFVCTDTWEYAAARRNSYVTGNCHSGWKLARTVRDYEGAAGTGQGYWDGGSINGDYNGCGWMRQADTSYYSADDTTECPTPDRANCEFMYCDAAHPNGVIYGTDTDGGSYPLTHDCAEVANFRPWSTSPVPKTAGAADGVTLRPRYRTQTMLLRYLAKNPWVYNGVPYYFVMARDPSITTEGQGNWVFMLAACFT